MRALDPAALTEDDFDALLAAVGLGGGTDTDADGPSMPEQMAQINALLDVVAPRLREALLVAFLDRLSRPVR